MKFPQSRTEIMDQVASFASDTELPDKEKEPLIRLALMHWNHVPDQSMPEETYDGFDPDWVSPVKQLNFGNLIDGASDYVDERCESLNQALVSVSKQLLAAERKRSSPDDDYSFIGEMNDLYKEKARIVDRLEVFGYEIIDRKVEFNIYNGSMRALNTSPSELKSISSTIIASDREFEVGVDMDMVSHEDTVSFVFYLGNKSVGSFVSEVAGAFSNAGLNKEDMDITVRDYNPSLPSFKHTRDQLKMDKEQERLKKDFSGLSNESFTP